MTKDTAKRKLLGNYSVMLEMDEPPMTSAGFVAFTRLRHSELQTLNGAVMPLRPSGPYPILWLEIPLVSCSMT